MQNLNRLILSLFCFLPFSGAILSSIFAEFPVNWDEFGPQYRNPFSSRNSSLNNRPIVCVLTQPKLDSMMDDPRFDSYSSYMMAAYPRHLNKAGARVVPIIYDHSFEENIEKINKCNGVYFAGGDAKGEYTLFAKLVFNHLKQVNDNGTFYPLWGTCLGFENLAEFASSNPTQVLSNIESKYQNPLLKFIKHPSTTQMFSPIGEQASVYENYNMTLNSHSFGISPDTFDTDEGLADIFIPTSISYNDSGIPFVTSMEGRKYPFFGTQFHPEKPMQIFDPSVNAVHTELSENFNGYFADFFVNQCRHNHNHFQDYSEEQLFLIENYDVIVKNDTGSIYYVFK